MKNKTNFSKRVLVVLILGLAQVFLTSLLARAEGKTRAQIEAEMQQERARIEAKLSNPSLSEDESKQLRSEKLTIDLSLGNKSWNDQGGWNKVYSDNYGKLENYEKQEQEDKDAQKQYAKDKENIEVIKDKAKKLEEESRRQAEQYKSTGDRVEPEPDKETSENLKKTEEVMNLISADQMKKMQEKLNLIEKDPDALREYNKLLEKRKSGEIDGIEFREGFNQVVSNTEANGGNSEVKKKDKADKVLGAVDDYLGAIDKANAGGSKGDSGSSGGGTSGWREDDRKLGVKHIEKEGAPPSVDAIVTVPGRYGDESRSVNMDQDTKFEKVKNADGTEGWALSKADILKNSEKFAQQDIEKFKAEGKDTKALEENLAYIKETREKYEKGAGDGVLHERVIKETEVDSEGKEVLTPIDPVLPDNPESSKPGNESIPSEDKKSDENPKLETISEDKPHEVSDPVLPEDPGPVKSDENPKLETVKDNQVRFAEDPVLPDDFVKKSDEGPKDESPKLETSGDDKVITPTDPVLPEDHGPAKSDENPKLENFSDDKVIMPVDPVLPEQLDTPKLEENPSVSDDQKASNEDSKEDKDKEDKKSKFEKPADDKVITAVDPVLPINT